jgi:hypothetical protein
MNNLLILEKKKLQKSNYFTSYKIKIPKAGMFLGFFVFLLQPFDFFES